MLLAKVPRSRAESVRKALFRKRLGRKDRRIRTDNDFVYIPLKEALPEELVKDLGIELVDGDAREKACYRPPYDMVLEIISLPEELRGLLPRHWEMLGDVLILRLADRLLPHKREVAEAYAKVLGARTVLLDRVNIEGVFRTPEMDVVWGDGTETIHFENGLFYKLDAARIMFSSGNIDEKLRMASLDCRGEVVVDMFAGIGYFTLPIAVHTGAAKVIACEINPLAFHYLRENIALNKVERIVEPVLGNNLDLPGERIADRIVMGYVRTTSQHLKKAFSLIKENGVIHYQDTFPLEVFPQMALDNVAKAAGSRSYNVERMREVKSYSPGVSHMVLDIRVLD
jgi:tRNA wybutosine-synthesizing protein 2